MKSAHSSPAETDVASLCSRDLGEPDHAAFVSPTATASRQDALCICSSVNTDYFRFLKRCLDAEGLASESIWALDEMQYRAASKRRGWPRLRLRWSMYVGYAGRLLLRAWRSRSGTVFIVTSNTFYAPLLVALIGKVRRFTTIHLLYDLFPDALEVSGVLRLNGLGARLVGSIARWTQRFCDGSVYLGPRLSDHARLRWGASRNDQSIDIGADDSLFRDHKPSNAARDLICHYGGQLGQMHDAQALAASVDAVLKSEFAELSSCRFHFNVSGSQAQFVRESLQDERVMVEDAIPAASWREKVRGFQVGLVTLSPGGASVCLPSKTYSMMAGGLAILAICPAWSDLARLVLDNQAGWVVNSSPYVDWQELAGPEYLARLRQRRPLDEIAREFERTLRHIAANPAELAEKRGNAWRCVRERYGVRATGERWRQYLGGRRGRSERPAGADLPPSEL